MSASLAVVAQHHQRAVDGSVSIRSGSSFMGMVIASGNAPTATSQDSARRAAHTPLARAQRRKVSDRKRRHLPVHGARTRNVPGGRCLEAAEATPRTGCGWIALPGASPRGSPAHPTGLAQDADDPAPLGQLVRQRLRQVIDSTAKQDRVIGRLAGVALGERARHHDRVVSAHRAQRAFRLRGERFVDVQRDHGAGEGGT